MWKQLLAYTLAFSMALETPATVYAAEQSGLTETVSEYGYELAESETPSVEQEDSVENPEEKPGGGTEKSDVEEDGALEGTEGEETDIVGDEAGENEDDNSDVSDAVEDGQESDSEETEKDQDAGSGESDSETEEKDSSDDSDDNADADEDVETVEESDVLENESEADVEVDTKTEEVLPVQAISVDGEIDYAFASTEGVTVNAPSSTNSKNWYSFTAPDDGNYLFYSHGVGLASDYQRIHAYLYTDNDTSSVSYAYDNIDNGGSIELVSGDMKKGETIYLNLFSDVSGGTSFLLKMTKLDAPGLASVEPAQDGSYIVDMGNNTITVTPRAGHKLLRVDAELGSSAGGTPEEGSYTVDFLYKDSNEYYSGNNGRISLSYREGNSASVTKGSAYSTGLYPVDMGSDYLLYYTVRNSDDDVIAFFKGTDVLTTGSTDKGVYIHDAKSGDDWITLDIEQISQNARRLFYAPTDGSTREREIHGADLTGWHDFTATGLLSGTEYCFRVCDIYGRIEYDQIKVSTTGETFSVKYKAEISKDLTTLTLSAEAENYPSGADEVHIRYDFTDELGRRISKLSMPAQSITEEDNGKITISYNENDAAFLAGKQYDIQMSLWIDGPGIAMYLDEMTCTVQAPDALCDEDAIKFTCTPDASEADQINYAITVTDSAAVNSGRIFYRPKNSIAEYERTNVISIEDGSASGSIADLTKGVTYEVELLIGGIRKTCGVSIPNDSNLVLKPADDAGDKVGPYDIVRTMKLEMAEGADVSPAEKYYLFVYYSTDGDNYNPLYASGGSSSYAMGIELNEDNQYQATISTAEKLSSCLLPDTDFYLRWVLADGSASSWNSARTPLCTLYEIIHTSSAKIKAESTASACDTQIFQITLDEEDVTVINKNMRQIELLGYLKKSSEDENAYKEATSASFRYYKNYSETMRLTGLEPETSYDLSLRDYYNTVVYKEFSFTTPKDERVIEISAIRSTMTTADIDFNKSGTTPGVDSVYLFLREKGENVWKQRDERNSTSENRTFRISGLKADTAYECMIGLADHSRPLVSELKKVDTKEFSTSGDSRSLSADEPVVTLSTAVLKASFSGNTEYKTSYVHFFYRIEDEDEQDWTKADSINVSNYVSRSCSATLTNLLRGTNYEYVIVLSEQANLVDPNLETRVGWKITGSFETEPIVAPTSIELSQEELYLNAAYPNADGFGRKQLRATVSPATAGQEVEWKSDNENIATVSSNGLVTAVGVGTTTITVTSIYTQEGKEQVSATCKVVVGNYKVGYEANENGDVEFVDTLSIPKGEPVETKYMLYQIKENEGPAKLDFLDYSVESSNSSVVVEWKDGIITVGNTGNAKLTFVVSKGDHAGVCAYLPVTVFAQGKGFDILDFTSSDEQYPAIKEDAAEDGNAQYTLAYSPGITYTAVGEISPYEYFDKTDFTWELTDENGNATDVASVDNGVVTPHKGGKVYLKVTAIKKGTLYQEKDRTVILNFKALPMSGVMGDVYALANVSSKIGEVAFPTSSGDGENVWDGWTWKYPDTPLVTNGVNAEPCLFEAVYQGEDYYPCEKTMYVHIAKVTGVSAYDDSSKVVEIASLSKEEQADSMTLTVSAIHQGTLNTSAYSGYTVDIPDISGITITEIGSDAEKASGTYRYKITAENKGTYTLKPEIKVTYTNQNGVEQTKTLAKTTYKIKAVDSLQVASIDISLAPETEGMAIEKINGQDGVVIDLTEKKASDIAPFTLNAVVKDGNGGELNTVLTWKTTDSSVATIKAETGNTHAAKVTVKGEGHAILTAVAKDDTGREAALRIEVRNRKPRVNASKVTVNLAYDYDNYYGMALAEASSGAVEIMPVYGKYIRSVSIYEGETVSTQFKVNQYYSNQWVVAPVLSTASDTIPKIGTYNCTLYVETTETDADGNYKYYTYPLKVTVTEKKAKVTAKAANTVNLFYTNEQAWINLKISGTYTSYTVQSISWNDNSDISGKGFVYANSYGSVSSTTNSIQRLYYFNQEAIELTSNNKLADPKVAKGTLTVRLYGYKEPYEIENVAIKWNYKKPSIVSQSASTTLMPSVGENRNRFHMYNKTEKKDMYYSTSSSSSTYYCYYAQAVCKNENVSVDPSDYYVTYTYNGTKSKGSEKINMTLMSPYWRKSVDVTHTMKFATPTAYLSYPTVTINTTKMGTVYSHVVLKNAYSYSLNCDDIVIEGKDQKSKNLLAKGLLEISQSGTYGIKIKQNRATTLAQTDADASIKNGTYTYKVTPYYTDSSGNRKALKTLTLKIKVTDKAVTAKTKTSGSLDLVNTNTYDYDNYIGLTPVFSNLGGGYTITDVKLCGEYSDYFSLVKSGNYGYAYLRIANYSKLKSGQKYKLSVQYTIHMTDGDTFTVVGANFTVKPKQTAPKVTISDNNQVIYTAEENASRTYYLYVPGYYYGDRYHISSVSGSLDCNKDGIPDITVTPQTTGNSYTNLTVRVADRDGLITSTNAKGKTYSIPITVTLQGRDGISKDVKTTIKVTVKR